MQEEKCQCPKEYPLVLQYHLVEEVLVCSHCNLDKEFGELPPSIKMEIANWTKSYRKAFKKWLVGPDRLDELSNPQSSLNQKGLAIAAKLNTMLPTYYWWHVNEDEYFDACPNCGKGFQTVLNGYAEHHKVCQQCRILVNDTTLP